MRSSSRDSRFDLSVAGAGPALDDWLQWLGPRASDGVRGDGHSGESFPPGGSGAKAALFIRSVRVIRGPAVADGRVQTGFIGQSAAICRCPPIRSITRFARMALSGFCGLTRPATPLWGREYDCPYTIDYPAGPRTTPAVTKGGAGVVGGMGDPSGADIKPPPKFCALKL